MRFFWEKLPGANQVGRLGRAYFDAQRAMPMHDHDGFAEVFWVRSGEGMQVLNGRRMTLRKGDVMFIRQADCHNFTGHPERGLTIMNLAMAIETVRHLRDRHFAPGRSAETPGAFWHPQTEPRLFHLPTEALAEVDRAGDHLSLRGGQPLEVERFVLNLAARILELSGAGGFTETPAQTPPPWLARALRAMEEHRPIETLSVERLVAACERTPEHVARVMRRCTGLTPSAWLRRLRVRWAAHLLDMTELSVTEIALDCGFNGISYFYKAFQEEYGISPARFRRSLLTGKRR